MKCSDIINVLEQLAPAAYACDWDNPGLLAGRMEKEVYRIVVALDATDEAIDLAVREKADMLITHHPLIFRPLKKVNDMDFVSARIVRLIQNDISYYVMHTNFDSAPGCMADLAAERLNLLNVIPLEPTGVAADGLLYGIGKIGELAAAMTLEDLTEFVKKVFSIPFALVYGMEELREPIKKIAVCPGSGKHMMQHVKAGGAQVLIAGDMGHHEGIDAVAEGVAVIDGGHYGLEYIFMDFMDTYIVEQFKGEIEVIKAPVKFPVSIL